MVNAPNISLKVVVVMHFVLSVWASMALPPGYAYMNAFILAFGFWAMVSPDSVEAVFMFMLLNMIAIVMDIIFISAFRQTRSTEKFSLAMCILNLILRAPASFVLYRLYQDRGGQYGDLGIPGMPNFGGGSGHRAQGYEDIDHSSSNKERTASSHKKIGHHSRGYENIDQPIPSNTVETASPHHSIDGKSPIP